MNLLSEHNKKVLPYLIGSIIILYICKPNIMYKPNGQLRNFGFGFDTDGYKKTLFTMQNIVIFITILLYYYL